MLRGLSDLSSGAFAAASDGTVYLLKGSEPNILYTTEDVAESSEEKITKLSSILRPGGTDFRVGRRALERRRLFSFSVGRIMES